MALRLPRLPNTQPPWDQMQIWWQRMAEATEAAFVEQGEAIEAIAAALEAAEAANTAAENANTAAAATSAETALNNSFVTNFTPPLLTAASTGIVTILDHDRQYGDGVTVNVDGDTVATGEPAGTVVYIYYEDPDRNGGAVTYLWSDNPADAAQTGSRHSVGAVEIPGVGSQDGYNVQPPGYAGYENFY